MFRKIPFSEKELETVGEIPGIFGRPGTPIRNTPVSHRENITSLYYEKKPYWIPVSLESRMFSSNLYSTRLSRGSRQDQVDVFGIEWEYVPAVGGSIVRPGSPFLEDVNDWKEKVIIPDVESWPWDEEAKTVTLDPRFSHEMSFVNGFWFERLISFMDFMPAAMALIDEDQTDAIKELFQATTDMACKLVDIFCRTYPFLDIINVHDDWGAQKAPFFSMDVAYELFVPYMKQLTDHIHSWGRIATLHSCGHNEDHVQAFIDGGFDQWMPQAMNNCKKLYDEYGDKIVFGVWPEPFDVENTTEEEQRAFARKFVDDYTQPGKPVFLSNYGSWALTPAFSEEMYRYSRQKYLEING